jgi:hypothetical protein
MVDCVEDLLVGDAVLARRVVNLQANIVLQKQFGTTARPARLLRGRESRGRSAHPSIPPEESTMESVLFDAAGHRRSPATMPGYHAGRALRNKGLCGRESRSAPAGGRECCDVVGWIDQFRIAIAKDERGVAAPTISPSFRRRHLRTPEPSSGGSCSAAEGKWAEGLSESSWSSGPSASPRSRAVPDPPKVAALTLRADVRAVGARGLRRGAVLRLRFASDPASENRSRRWLAGGG